MLKRLFRNLLLFGVVILLFSLIVEVSLRIFYPSPFQKNAWQSTELVGHEHVPNKYVRFKSKEFDNSFQINSEGWFDQEYDWFNKSKNTYRILMLGDSFTEALQVPFNKSFHYLLEEKLNLDNSKKYEVINMGVSAYSTKQEYYILKEKMGDYNPDMVILNFYEGNDFEENLKPIKEKTLLKDFLRNHFYSYSIVKDFKNALFFKEKTYSTSPLNLNMINITTKYLKMIEGICDIKNIPLLIVSIPYRNQKKKNLNEICKKENFKCLLINLSEEDYYTFNGHLNEGGHQKVFNQVYQYFKNLNRI